MQTFLPVPSLSGSASLLDRQRLGKQRVETYQIMQALTGLTMGPAGLEAYVPPASIAKHWVTRMWDGHAFWLLAYQAAVTHEWTIVRGYRDTTWDKTRAIYYGAGMRFSDPQPPQWWGDDEFHLAHQARLVAKDPGLYGELFPGVGPAEDYDFRWRAA